METYPRDVAEAIIKRRQAATFRLGFDGTHQKDDFIVKDDGVFPVKGVASSKQEFQDSVWRPACELSAQAIPIWQQPGLPIPFNALELAAFFLHGNGWYVRDLFGAWEDGPDVAVFENMILPDDDLASLIVLVAEKAVREAYAAYRAAECVVGPFDNTLACVAQKLEDGFWNADVSQRTTEQREALRTAHKKADDAEAAWRKKMVNQLLTVAQVPVAPPMVTTTQAAATPAPEVAVVPASDARPDPERRLALLRELGGAAKYARCEWTFTGIKALVTREKAAGRRRSTEKTVRADLKEAAQNERDAKNAGFATGLGQR